MISVLIPIFNFDVRALVQELVDQAQHTAVPHEINCLDDGSDWAFRKVNKAVASLPHVHYKELSTNVGRSRIRNLLAEQAQFDSLLFLDCDGIPLQSDFMEAYLKHLPTRKVVVGGRKYQKETPPSSQILHWQVGKQREAKLDAGFQSNNFLIARSTFLSIKFDEQLKGYGHEDTLFGHELKSRDLQILHMNNPVMHLGLETSEVFLQKQEEAIHNLVCLKSTHPWITTRLTILADQIEHAHLTKVFIALFAKINLALKKNLLSNKPRLISLDMYKIGLYLTYKR